jgi:hypothetical protein
MSQGEFTAMRSMDLYYQYLNAGIQLPIGAGTDKMGDNIPVGSNRLYVPFTGDPGYDKWVAGLKAGNGFVTNGPMLTFDVDGQGSGEVVQFGGTRKVRVRATARSILPFQSLEIVGNGETALIRNVNPRPGPHGLYGLELEGTIDIDRSTWLAARVADSPARRNRIMPRELTVFAHTGSTVLCGVGEVGVSTRRPSCGTGFADRLVWIDYCDSYGPWTAVMRPLSDVSSRIITL